MQYLEQDMIKSVCLYAYELSNYPIFYNRTNNP